MSVSATTCERKRKVLIPFSSGRRSLDMSNIQFRKFQMKNRLDDLITVCDKCLTASCWQGLFMCQESLNAGTVQISVADLIELDREHPCYWRTE